PLKSAWALALVVVLPRQIPSLNSLLDGTRPRHRLGSPRRLAVMVPAAIRADHLGIIVGHLVQESGKRLAAITATSPPTCSQNPLTKTTLPAWWKISPTRTDLRRT